MIQGKTSKNDLKNFKSTFYSSTTQNTQIIIPNFPIKGVEYKQKQRTKSQMNSNSEPLKCHVKLFIYKYHKPLNPVQMLAFLSKQFGVKCVFCM